ncbi:MAG: folate-binding protein [Gallionella sp.]
MNKEWQDFLAARGARLEDGAVGDFGDIHAERIATRDATVMCDLSQFGTLRVSGVDAQDFLQNLLSNDIRAVTPTQVQLSSLNSPKGRMLASMLIWREGDDYILQLPQALCEPIRKKLTMYVLRANVQVTDVSEETVLLGLSGTTCVDVLQAAYGELSHATCSIVRSESGNLIKVGKTRWQIATTRLHAVQFWDFLRTSFRPAGSSCWDWLNIRSGIPVILPQTREQFVAQMVNFDLIDGVSFGKGCYPGQEIVARTRYLGKLKRRMYLAHIDCAAAPMAGDELYSADMDGQASGMVVNSAASPGGGYDVLAVVQISSIGAHPVCIGSLQGAPLSFQALPYTLT